MTKERRATGVGLRKKRETGIAITVRGRYTLKTAKSPEKRGSGRRPVLRERWCHFRGVEANRYRKESDLNWEENHRVIQGA